MPASSWTATVKLSELQYDLPPERIAQQPCQPRDAARLLVLDRRTGRIAHRVVRQLPEYLRDGDCLVINTTRVLPAKFVARRATGGKIAGLFVGENGPGRWNVLLAGVARIKEGERLALGGARWTLTLSRRGERGACEVTIDPPDSAADVLEQIGSAPLPPYIRREAPDGAAMRETRGATVHESGGIPMREGDLIRTHEANRTAMRDADSAAIGEADGAATRGADGTAMRKGDGTAICGADGPAMREGAETAKREAGDEAMREADGELMREADRDRYQTVYAREPGAIAAPTAGMHFTKDLLEEIRARGIAVAEVVLHVGLGTFQPVEVSDLADHRMHSEQYGLSSSSAAAIRHARSRGGRIIAVGTTSVRVLESCVEDGELRAGSGWTDLLIYPPYEFRAVDVLLTNFHLPGSTLLALVCAFAGRDAILAAYRTAVAEGYRFYSYGDAMLIL